MTLDYDYWGMFYEPYLHCEWNEPVIFDQMGKQFTAINQDSKIVNQGFPIEEIIGSHQKIPMTRNKIQVNILSKKILILS